GSLPARQVPRPFTHAGAQSRDHAPRKRERAGQGKKTLSDFCRTLANRALSFRRAGAAHWTGAAAAQAISGKKLRKTGIAAVLANRLGETLSMDGRPV